MKKTPSGCGIKRKTPSGCGIKRKTPSGCGLKRKTPEGSCASGEKLIRMGCIACPSL
jgi:hypothetical protein